ncbi:MAG: hypothetical protein ACXV3D_06995 [Halobacteriota archaeon]
MLKTGLLQGGFQIWLKDTFLRRKFQLLTSRRYFVLGSTRYRYFYHTYNATWRNERAIEVPIVYQESKKYDAQKILEVGNVLSHYHPVAWNVIDLCERAPGVINVDIADFSPAKKYDLIISVSTLEHVGFDEAFFQALSSSTPGARVSDVGRSAEKVVSAISRLKGCLSEGGRLLITVPLGYNEALDQLLSDQALFTSQKYMRQVSQENRWVEVKESEISDARYECSPYWHATVLAICVFINRP